MRPVSSRSLLFLICLIQLTAACGPPVAVTSTATLPAPSVEVIQFTDTPSPSPLPPFVSPTPDPSATPGPTPTRLPTPEGRTGPADYPPDVNPLTGLRVADPALLDKRPLAVKISNYPPCVRPQSGLSAADLVFEHYAEGGTTRFTAIFYGQNPGVVGSVRSARFIDLELPAMYQSLLAFSGASDGLLPRFRAADFRPNILSPEFGVGCSPFCRRPLDQTPCGKAGTPLLEHSLFSNTRDLWAYADTLGINQKPKLTGMVFNPEPAAGGSPGERLTVAYVASFVQWTYDKNLGLYFRRQDGNSHKDANTEQPITAANVVVLFVPHVVTDIIEDTVGYNPQTKAGGHYSLQIQLWGVGPAIVFRDGQAVAATWTRFGRNAELSVVYSGDNHVPLKPGNTWFEIVPHDSAHAQEGAVWTVKAKSQPNTPFGK